VEKLILHEDPISANCYKVCLTAAHLGIALERREYDIRKGETRTPDFLHKINANGCIPVLQIGDAYLPESNAISLYLATGSDLIPQDRLQCADVMRWMFFEQYNLEPNIGPLIFWRTYLGEDRLNEIQRMLLPVKTAAGNVALALLDGHLAKHDFLVGNRFSLADIVLYAYTHVAGRGGFNLGCYPNVERWLQRVASQPGHVEM
jgi:glutathione S-transferase